MRGVASVWIVCLGLTCSRHAAAQAAQVAAPVTAQAAADSLDYNKAVATVWGSITSTDNVVRWCTKNVSKSKTPIEKSYKDWKTRFAPLIAEIDKRIDQVMNPAGAYDAKEVAARKADVLKRGAARYDAQLANAPQSEAKHECELLPGYFSSASFDLEAHFAQELALIRARPLAAH